MKITMNNGNDPAYTAMLDGLITEVFGISFAPWLARKLWDDKYESYSFIENGNMLANVCIFKADMRVSGQPVRVHQFGAVATRKNERGKGLSRKLMNHVLDIYPNTPAFLAANDSVLDFYPPFGFRRVQTYLPALDVAINNGENTAEKCNIDDARVQHALYGQRVYSRLLDVTNMQSVEIFNMIMGEGYPLFYLPACGAVVVAYQMGTTLHLKNVLSPQPLAFDELAKQLPFHGITRVEFGFNPDWLGVNPQWAANNDPYFLRGAWGLPTHFRFPALAET
jgi:GNAT superfamily N-acetyltransferase